MSAHYKSGSNYWDVITTLDDKRLFAAEYDTEKILVYDISKNIKAKWGL